jgi:NitT/TauT family transport system substrate-binding protein
MKSKLFHGSRVSVVLFAVFAFLFSGCGGGVAEDPQPVAPKDKVTMQFGWLHQIEYTGFHLAAEKGFYDEENIEITLVPGGPGTDPLVELAEGRAQFGLSRGASLVTAKSGGQDILAIGTVFRKDPLFIMSLASSQIATPKDLEGKTIAVNLGDIKNFREIQFVAMMNTLGVDMSTMKFVVFDNANPLGQLQSGGADAVTGLFATNDLVTTKMQGGDVSAMYYNDYGVAFYVNAIFGSEKFIRENPDLTRRFMRATLRGYQYALEHPDEAVAATLKYDETLDAEIQAAQMTAQIPLIDTGDQAIGWMDEQVWQSTVDILLDSGFIPSAIDVKSLYTNEFIK